MFLQMMCDKYIMKQSAGMNGCEKVQVSAPFSKYFGRRSTEQVKGLRV